MKSMRNIVLLSCAVIVLTACGKSAEEKSKQQAAIAEQRRIECLEKLCPGDKEPMLYDHTRYQLFKRGGRFFLGPKEYGGFNGSFGFYWPSKTPASARTKYNAPEYKSGDSDTPNNFYDVAIEFFIVGSPVDSTGARDLLEKVEKEGWVASRTMVRPDLEQITQRNDVPGHERTLYVATALKGLDGKPPVAGCSHDDTSHGGGTSFMWKPSFKVWARWNQRHCVDWPEIYSEIINVLNQVKEVQP